MKAYGIFQILVVVPFIAYEFPEPLPDRGGKLDNGIARSRNPTCLGIIPWWLLGIIPWWLYTERKILTRLWFRMGKIRTTFLTLVRSPIESQPSLGLRKNHLVPQLIKCFFYSSIPVLFLSIIMARRSCGIATPCFTVCLKPWSEAEYR